MDPPYLWGIRIKYNGITKYCVWCDPVHLSALFSTPQKSGYDSHHVPAAAGMFRTSSDGIKLPTTHDVTGRWVRVSQDPGAAGRSSPGLEAPPG